jgi:ABC-type nitrate/sulfonate/bicarbonate transport system ATPase subunit
MRMNETREAPAIAFTHVSKHFARNDGAALLAVDDADFAVAQGEIVALLGPSGSGKTTLLNMAAGLIAPDAGRVGILGREGTVISWRRIGYMFQDDRLLPWRSAAANVALALEAEAMPASARRTRAEAMLALVGLADFAQSFPHELSGGMRSRVALARSLVTGPEILLMDEPFARLDAPTRAQMHGELLALQARNRLAILFVTHDAEEAVALANRIIVLSARPGRIRRTLPVALPRPRTGMAAIDLVTGLRGDIADAHAMAAS